MVRYVVGFAETDQYVDIVGGKGAHLAELSRIEGIRVPAGFCVTTDAFDAGQLRQTRALASNSVDVRIGLGKPYYVTHHRLRGSTASACPGPTHSAGDPGPCRKPRRPLYLESGGLVLAHERDRFPPFRLRRAVVQREVDHVREPRNLLPNSATA